MKNAKGIISVLLALMMLFALVACNSGSTGETKPENQTAPSTVEKKPDENPAPQTGNETKADQQTEAPAAESGEQPSTETAEPAAPAENPPAAEEVKLGGITVTEGTWWDQATYDPQPPTTEWDQIVADYRAQLEEDHEFTYECIGIQNFGDYNETLVNSFLEKDPVCSIFRANPETVTAMAAQGLLYDLSTLDAFDFENDPLWSDKIVDYFTINGAVYAARPGIDEPRDGLFFNKRMLEEAGYSPDYIYDLQAAGEWDWAHFEELCAKLTKDIDNDGVTDIYALTTGDGSLIQMGFYTNGAKFVETDENGLFVDGTLNPAFQEGCEWAVSLIEKGYVRPKMEGDGWDANLTAFANGKAAMVIAQTWVIGGYFSGMEDDWGFALEPAGPNGVSCAVMYPTALAIPSCIDLETANKIAYAINEWYHIDRIPEYEEMGVTPLDGYYSQFRDARAVDETIMRMVTPGENQVYDSYYLVPNYNIWGYIVNVFNRTQTAAQAIEENRPVNQANIDAANALFAK